MTQATAALPVHRGGGAGRSTGLPRVLRSLLVVLAASGLSMLAPGLASTASAAGPTTSTIDSPGPGPYTSTTTLTLAGTVRRSPVATDPVSLSLQDPNGATQPKRFYRAVAH